MPVDASVVETHPSAKVITPNGESRGSLLDEICRRHDGRYSNSIGQINESELKFHADIEMLNEINFYFDQMTDKEKSYARAATVSFSAKLVLVDIPLSVREALKNAAVSFLERANEEKSLPPVEVVDSRDDGSALTCEEDPDGNFIFACKKDGQVQSITLDSQLQVRELSQQYLDEQGNTTEETVISLNSAKNIAEVHISINDEKIASGVVVGELNQEKLDKFSDLALSMSDPLPEASGNSSGNVADDAIDHPIGTAASMPVDSFALHASSVMQAMNIDLDPTAAASVDHWFEQADPIHLAPYRWTSVDANLNNLWEASSAGSNASFDLYEAFRDQGLSLNAMSSYEEPSPGFIGASRASPGMADFYSPDQWLSAVDLSQVSVPLPPAESAFFSDGAPAFAPFTYQPDIFQSYIDPIVLQFGSRKVHTTSREASGVLFDMAANGQKVRTGWITPDEAFLVMDRNGNGTIDDSTELFSEHTSATAKSGFAALGELDSNRNGYVDSKDKQFKWLRLWTDINSDGVSQTNELHKLRDKGIDLLSCKKPVAVNVYDNGNMILSTSEYFTYVRHSGVRSSQMCEVLLNYGDQPRVNQVYISDQSSAVRMADGRSMVNLQGAAAQHFDAFAGGVNILAGGKGDILSAGNARQSLLIGNGGTQMFGNGGQTHFVVNGSGNMVTTGTGSAFIEVNGDKNTIRATKGDNAIDVAGNSNSVTVGDEDSIILGGDSNKLTATGKTGGNEIVITGHHGIVNASHSDIALAEYADVTLNGRNDDIVQLGHSTLKGKVSGGSLLVWGEDNQASISNAFVGVMEGGELELRGVNDQVVMAGHAQLDILGSASKMKVSVFGEDNQLSMAGGSVVLDEGAELSLTGAKNKVTMLGDNELTMTGAGNRVDVFDDNNLINASRATIIEHSGADAEVSGSGNLLRSMSETAAQQAADVRAEDAFEQHVSSIVAQWRLLLDSPLVDTSDQMFGRPDQPAGDAPLNLPIDRFDRSLLAPDMAGSGMTADPSLGTAWLSRMTSPLSATPWVASAPTGTHQPPLFGMG